MVVIAKNVLQDVWRVKATWYKELNDNILNKWRDITKSFGMISSITIPRHMSPGPSNKAQLHGFADASQAAYGVVVYLSYGYGKRTWLVVAKSRVAPLKQISIPRLELKAALLLHNYIILLQKKKYYRKK